MIKKNLENNFIKYFDGSFDNVNSYILNVGISLIGNNFSKINLTQGGLVLSIGTGISIMENNTDYFNVITGEEDVLYKCHYAQLTSYKQDEFEKNIFSIIEKARGKIKGADIVINYDVTKKELKRTILSIFCALSDLNNRKNELYSVNDIDEKNFVKCELKGVKNSLFLFDGNNEEYLPLDISEYKLILICSDIKKIDVLKDLKRANEELKKNYPYLKQINDYILLKRKNIKFNDVFKNFIINECERIKYVEEKLKKYGKIDCVCDILESSARELCNITKTKGKEILKMMEISKKTGISEANVFMGEYGGILAFVKSENVDLFIDIFYDEYQKKAGTLPAFYICEDCDGYLTSDIKSE